MCHHVPRCPSPTAADRSAARIVSSHPEQGWSLLCNGVILFEDSGQLVPEGEGLVPRKPPRQPRPRWGHRRRLPGSRRPRTGPEHAIVLAGGRGSRLFPLTRSLPKPLVELGPYPILEITLRRLHATGVRRVTLCVNHRGDQIRDAIGDGHRLGVAVDYTEEDRPLGTAGPLRLVRDWSGPALVVNADVLSAVDFADLYRRHARSRAALTVAYQRRQVPTSVGVLRVQGNRVREIWEKPDLAWNVVSGIYVADPCVRDLIAPGEPVDMPDLVGTLLSRGRRVGGYGFAGPWHDIGTPELHRRATRDFLADPQLYLDPSAARREDDTGTADELQPLRAAAEDDVPAPQEERWAS